MPNPVDISVGTKIRMRRTFLKMSQTELANSVGVTFQQIQKYERGLNRIGSSRLYHFARVLSVPIAYFFDEVIDAPAHDSEVLAPNSGISGGFQNELLNDVETRDFIMAYYKISKPSVRKRVADLIKVIATP